MSIKVSSTNPDFDPASVSPGVVVDDDGNVYVRDLSAKTAFIKQTPNQYGHTYGFVFFGRSRYYDPSITTTAEATSIERYPFSITSGTSTLITSTVPNLDDGKKVNRFLLTPSGYVSGNGVFNSPEYGSEFGSVGVFNSSTAGYLVGGENSNNNIQKFVYVSDTDVTTVGSVGSSTHASSYSSPTHGYFISGTLVSAAPGTYSNYYRKSTTKYKFSFASEGVASSVADMSDAAGTPPEEVRVGLAPSYPQSTLIPFPVSDRGVLYKLYTDYTSFIGPSITQNPNAANNLCYVLPTPVSRGFYSETYGYKNGMTSFAFEYIAPAVFNNYTYPPITTSGPGRRALLQSSTIYGSSGDPKNTRIRATDLYDGTPYSESPSLGFVMMTNHHESSIEKFPFAVDESSYTLLTSPGTGSRGSSIATTQSATDGWMLGQTLSYNPSPNEALVPITFNPYEVDHYFRVSAKSQKLPFASDVEVVGTVANLIISPLSLAPPYFTPTFAFADTGGIGSITTDGENAFIGNWCLHRGPGPSTPYFGEVGINAIGKYPFTSTAEAIDVGQLSIITAGTGLHF